LATGPESPDQNKLAMQHGASQDILLVKLPQLPEMDQLQEALNGALALCVRKGTEEPEHYDTLWFALLDKMAEYVRVASQAKSPLDDFVEGGGTGAHVLEILRVLFRLVVGRMVDGEEDQKAKSLGEKLQSVFTKLLCDYHEATLSEMRGCLSDLLARAAFHVQSRTSSVKLENNSVFKMHDDYVSIFKTGHRFAEEDCDDNMKPEEEQRDDLRAQAQRYDEVMLLREQGRAKFILDAIMHHDDEADISMTTESKGILPVTLECKSTVKPSIMPDKPVYFKQADVFSDGFGF